MTELKIKFLNSTDGKSICFLPYGVTSIEFSADGKCRAGNIYPRNSTLFDPYKEQYVGYAEGNQDFLVVWGGGNKQGQYIKQDATDRMFMQLIHKKGDHNDASIIFRHSVAGTKELTIQKPKNAPPTAEISKMVDADAGKSMIDLAKGESLKTFEGKYFPEYYSRWFPPQEIKYIAPLKQPQIFLKWKEDELGIKSPVEIFSRVGEENKSICTIDGDLKYSQLHAELFSLLETEGIFVLRVWFYWIHTRFEKGLLDSSGESGISDSHDLGAFDRLSGVEVPDIERFDFVLTPDFSKITLYATDIHYQEYWGIINETPVKASIAGFKDVAAVTAVLYPLRFLQDQDLYDPIEAVKSYVCGKLKAENCKAMVVKEGQENDSKSLKAGDIRAHVPYISQSVIGEKRFLSSDSRKLWKHE